MEYKIYKYDELAHHGIKGMKWGIRRFQNKDGSLTKAGLKRRAKLESELKQLGGRNKRSDGTNEPPRKKTVAEMTDDELRAHTNRMRVEKEYYDAQKNLAIANPRQVSKGEKFMKSLMGEVVAPAAKNAGREWLEKFMKDKLGLNDVDPVKKVQKEAEKYKALKEIEDYKSQIKKFKGTDDNKESKMPETKTWDDYLKKQQWEDNEEKRRKRTEHGDS